MQKFRMFLRGIAKNLSLPFKNRAPGKAPLVPVQVPVIPVVQKMFFSAALRPAVALAARSARRPAVAEDDDQHDEDA